MKHNFTEVEVPGANPSIVGPVNSLSGGRLDRYLRQGSLARKKRGRNGDRPIVVVEEDALSARYRNNKEAIDGTVALIDLAESGYKLHWRTVTNDADVIVRD